jgi:PAS domain S-box-containing protein
MPIHILLVSSSEQLVSNISAMIPQIEQEKYNLTHIKNYEETIPPSDVVLLDQNALPDKSLDYLAQVSFLLSPRPIILLLQKVPESEKEYRSIKSLTDDYLLQSQLNFYGLNNTVKYALETRRLKVELEQQQKRYSSLFYNAVEPAFFLDEELKITGVNDAFLNVFGIVKRAALNKPLLDFIELDEDRREVQLLIEKLEKGSLDINVKLCSPETKKKFLGRLKISPINESSIEEGVIHTRLTSYHGTLKNISFENRLKAIKESNEKIATTYKLARALAHEIRNPLTNVNLAIDQLKEETKERQDLELYYDIIQRCTGRIDALLGQLLTSSEQHGLEKEAFDGVTLMKEVVAEIKDRSTLEGVELTADYEIKKAPLIGDRKRMKIALTNLFTNALESMDKPEKKIHSYLYEDENYLYIDVEDNGVGMDEEQLESLFDPFYTSKANGVGLGLTSTQTIVAEHNGEIEVKSEKGRGSTFSVCLPLSQ